MEIRYYCSKCREKVPVWVDGKTGVCHCKKCDSVILDGCDDAIIYEPYLYIRECEHIDGGAYGQ